MTEQPGYDALAELYDESFPTAYRSQAERSAIDLFADALGAVGPGPVLDVGCGTGHQAADLSARGFPVVGLDPSGGMLARARRHFPDLPLVRDDALLRAVAPGALSGVLARWSLIHVPPDQVPPVLASWAARLRPGGVVLVAFQGVGAEEAVEVEEYDHTVTPAWRWRPDALAAALAQAGFAERWRLVVQAGAEARRPWPECYLLVTRTDG